jgi:hypothetical protein
MEWIWLNVKKRQRPSIVNMSQHGSRNQFWNDQASRVRITLVRHRLYLMVPVNLKLVKEGIHVTVCNVQLCEMEIDYLMIIDIGSSRKLQRRR